MFIACLFNNYRTIIKRERNIYSRIIRKYLIVSLEISIIDTSNLFAILMLHLFYRFKNLNYLIHY